MLCSSRPASWFRWLPGIMVCALVPLPARAQSASAPPLDHVQFGIGYVADLPSMEVGGGAYAILPRWGGVGLYVDAKFQVSGPTHELSFEPDLTAEQLESDVGGSYIRTEGTWWSVNAALLRPLSPYFTLYAGGGLAHVTSYRLYDQIDRDLDVGFGGVAWVEDPRGTRYRPNLMIGTITRLTSRLSAHFGYETSPDGVTAGLTLRFPRW